MSAAGHVVLTYGRSNPFNRRLRGAIKLLIIASAIIVAFEPARRAAGNGHEYVRYYFERRAAEADCVTYTVPRGTLIADETPLRAFDGLIVQHNSEASIAEWNATDTPAQAAARRAAILALTSSKNPKCWNTFQTYSVLPAGRPQRVRCVSCLRQRPSFFGMTRPPPAVLLLHGLRAPSGPRRLVCVTFNAGAFEWTGSPPFEATVYADSGLARSLACWNGRLSDPAVHRQDQPLKIYAAQLDPLDESQFTIRFDLGTRSHILDGRLAADDHVTLHTRD